MLPQGLYFKADVTGRDPAGWSVKGWYWAEQVLRIFADERLSSNVSVANSMHLPRNSRQLSMLESWNNKFSTQSSKSIPASSNHIPISRLPSARLTVFRPFLLIDPTYLRFTWTIWSVRLTLVQEIADFIVQIQPAPLPVAPGGSRYSVDEEKSFVHWQDFTFYYTFSRDTGIRLFDIKYKGDTIIYELGLEEAIAHYAAIFPLRLSSGDMLTATV